MDTSLIVLWAFTCVCFVLQLLPIMSVPLTGKAVDYNLFLSEFNDLKFGVFGVCNITTDTCSLPKIGYPATVNNLDSSSSPSGDAGFLQLPSRTRYTVSKLLIVHVVGFSFSAILFLILGGLVLNSLWQDRQRRKLKQSRQLLSPQALVHLKKLIRRARPPKKCDGFLVPYLTINLMLSLLSFLLTLLAFLVDILLFVPHLGYVGWLQLCPVVITMVIACMLCFMKRSIESRRLYDRPYVVEFDDMRTKRSSNDLSRFSTASDDGFFVYTNGFYSSQKPETAVLDSELHEPQWEWHNRNDQPSPAPTPSDEVLANSHHRPST